MPDVYAYVDGSHLSDVADLLLRRLHELVRSEPWASEVWVVDDRTEEDDTLSPGDLPDF